MKPITGLRFIMKGNKRILQYQTTDYDPRIKYDIPFISDWADVEMVVGKNKPTEP